MKGFLHFAITNDTANPEQTTRKFNNGHENVFSNVKCAHRFLSTGGYCRESNISALYLEMRGSDFEQEITYNDWEFVRFSSVPLGK
jgi:hypothetical protein